MWQNGHLVVFISEPLHPLSDRQAGDVLQVREGAAVPMEQSEGEHEAARGGLPAVAGAACARDVYMRCPR
jgi:hypothetical protein